MLIFQLRINTFIFFFFRKQKWPQCRWSIWQGPHELTLVCVLLPYPDSGTWKYRPRCISHSKRRFFAANHNSITLKFQWGSKKQRDIVIAPESVISVSLKQKLSLKKGSQDIQRPVHHIEMSFFLLDPVSNIWAWPRTTQQPSRTLVLNQEAYYDLKVF